MEFMNFGNEVYSQIFQTTQGEVTLSKTLEIFLKIFLYLKKKGFQELNNTKVYEI